MRGLIRAFAAVALACAVASPAPGQVLRLPSRPAAEPVDAQDAPPPLPSIEALRERIAALEADTSVAAEIRDAALTDYRAAVDALQRRDALAGEEATLRTAAAEAPLLIEQYQAELAQPPQPVVIDGGAESTLAQLGEAVAAATADLSAARDELQRLQTEVAARTARLEAIPKEINEVRARLADMPAAGPSPAASAADEARDARRRAERAAAAAQLSKLEAESASIRARQDLLPLRRDRVQRRVDLATQALDQWRTLEEERRGAEARRREAEAAELQRQAAQQAPPLVALASEISVFASAGTGPNGTVEQLTRVRARLNEAGQALDRLEARARSTVAKVSVAGLSDAVGVVLRKELGELGADTNIRLQREELRRKIGDAQYRLIVIEERLAEVNDIEAVVPRLLASIDPATVNATPQAVETLARELLTSLREELTRRRNEYTDYIEAAADLDTALASTARLRSEYKEFITERVLWTRSVPGQRLPRAENLADAAAWALSAREWSGVAATLASAIAPPSLATASLATALLAVLALNIPARRRLIAIADSVRRVGSDRFVLTLGALPLTVLLAAPLGLAMWTLSAMLVTAPGGLAAALSTALSQLGLYAFLLDLAIQFSRPAGLAESHFRWSREGLADYRRNLRVVKAVGLPISAVMLTFIAQPNNLWADALGRLAFITILLVLAAFYAYAFAPWRPFVGNHLKRHPGSILARLRWVWYPLIALTPVTTAVLSAAGYFYTAMELDRRLQFTIWLILIVIVLHSIFLRWLFVERRRLTLQRARQKREAEGADGAATERPAEADGLLEVPEIDTQTRRVLGAVIAAGLVVGLFVLWADVLPALRMLERVQVFPQFHVLQREPAAIPSLEAPGPAAPVAAAAPTAEPAANGAPAPIGGLLLPQAPQAEAASLPVGAVTVHDIAIAVIIVVMTYVLSRNLPGLLEITILNRLPLDPGSRFAISAVLRYVLAVVGILLAFSALGIGWSKVQWLVAALTFGLAFGLQEVFANFISGLLMLIERPVRVGDTVTVANVSGTVTKIQMRATTIRDWELKELIIPNKVFITDQVVNWTLSDPRTRITVSVGVAYGTDVRLVERELLAIARTQKHVLEDPRPRALFVGFGDSVLNFELRCFLDHVDNILDARSNLHMRVAERFKEVGIEIAFPQRDLHIKDIDPLLQLAMGRRRGAEHQDGVRSEQVEHAS